MKLNTKKIASIQAANAGTPCELFTVSVVGYNRSPFCLSYIEYIVAAEPAWYENYYYTLCAPAEVRQEIADLVEEGITIEGEGVTA